MAHFGEPRPHPKGERQNVFGAEDELKTAPKGVAKNHKYAFIDSLPLITYLYLNLRDIDLLKCRSLAVLQRYVLKRSLGSTGYIDLIPVLLTNRFTDDQVLMGTFMQELEKVARILRPFVHW